MGSEMIGHPATAAAMMDAETNLALSPLTRSLFHAGP
jgi:hypothetical protein